MVLAGETLFVKLFMFDESDVVGSLSKIAYIELIGNDLQPVFSHKIRIVDGMADADFLIPTTIKSGNYKLIAYTKWMLESSTENFTRLDLGVINPFFPFDGLIDTIPAQNTARNESRILMAKKKEYSLRERVAVTIPGKLSGDFVLSVRKSDGLGEPAVSKMNKEFPTSSVRNAAGLPELRGELLTGKLTSKNGGGVAGKTVSLAIPGDLFLFKIVKTDIHGNFAFEIDRTPSSSDVILEVMEDDRENYILTLDAPKRPDLSSLVFNPLKINPNLKHSIEQRSVANQVENAYSQQKQPEIIQPREVQPFYHPLQKTYVLDDYTRFPSVRETIIEVIKELYFKKRKNNFSIHLHNLAMDTEYFGRPLLLIDGQLIQDVDELFEYPAKNIHSVDIVNLPYVLGSKTFSGIVSVRTKNQDYKSRSKGDHRKQLSMSKPLPQKIPHIPAYPDINLKNSRIPDYRHQLAWMPKVNPDGTEINFFTSDIDGEFEILLYGFSDAGKPIIEKTTIEVK